MKKILSLTMALILLLTTFTVFADMEEKLAGHWSEKMIEKEFVAYYFPYLARGYFEKLEPNEEMNNRDFSLSLGSLAKDYELAYTSNNIISNKRLTRKEVVKTLGNKLKDIKDLKRGKLDHSFKDIDTMDDEAVELLGLLYDLEIINGVSKDRFAPDKIITQAEAIVLLQRTKRVLDEMDQVSFTTKGVLQSYNNQEAIIVKQNGDKILLTITKEFGTPGYGMAVDKIVREEESKYQIYLNITPPKAGTVLAQVITYKTITIEIEEEELRGKRPYIFMVEGIKSNLF